MGQRPVAMRGIGGLAGRCHPGTLRWQAAAVPLLGTLPTRTWTRTWSIQRRWVHVDDLLHTLPAQRELKEFGKRKIRLRCYGKHRAQGMLCIPRLVGEHGGWVINHHQFSDAASTLLLELPEPQLIPFARRLSGREADGPLQQVGLVLDLSQSDSLDLDSDVIASEASESPAASGTQNVAILLSIEWTLASFDQRTETGDLSKFIKPDGS